MMLSVCVDAYSLHVYCGVCNRHNADEDIKTTHNRSKMVAIFGSINRKNLMLRSMVITFEIFA